MKKIYIETEPKISVKIIKTGIGPQKIIYIFYIKIVPHGVIQEDIRKNKNIKFYKKIKEFIDM